MAKRLFEVRHSLWFEPILMLGLAVALGIVLPILDGELPQSLQNAEGWARWTAVSAGGARATMSTSATALATILAISVTATMVVIQLAAGSYTSRLLRRFLSDRPMRLLLGSFTGSVLYLILVLGAVRSAEEGPEFVPGMSILFGRLLTIACLAMLIVFVNYTARSVQVATIVRRVTRDAIDSVQELEGQQAGRRHADAAPAPPSTAAVVTTKSAGYIQAVDEEDVIAATAGTPEGVVRFEAAPGDFLLHDSPLVYCWSNTDASPGESTPTELPVKRIRDAFAIGRERTVEQDPGFAVRQLTDMAVKALSPAVNDPTTAVMVVNEIGEISGHLLRARRLGGWQTWRSGRQAIWARSFGLVASLEALVEITDAGAQEPRVLSTALQILSTLRGQTPSGPLATAIDGAADQIKQLADSANLSPRGRAMLRAYRS